MPAVHRALLAVLLIGNTIAFAGVDPPTRLLSALIILVLVLDVPRPPPLPRPVRWAAVGLAALVVLQLVPLPEILRRTLQPGYTEVMHPGWSPLSLAPWSTAAAAASVVLAAGVALTAMRMAATRSGLPLLLALLTATCGLLGVLGLAGESGAPEKVLLVRANTGGGDVYGPFVNSNHFAVAVELCLPAALVLLAVSGRNLARPGAARQRAAVVVLSTGVIAAVALAALLRSGSRGGVLFIVAALLLTVPLWARRHRARRWPWVVVAVAVALLASALAWTRAPALREGFADLLVLEGVEGNTRWDLWGATLHSFARSPLVGSGLGSYRFVIGLDKPATGTAVLEQAHNDWLEWLSTTGIMGAAVLAATAWAVALGLRPRRTRRLRHELRYPLAGASLAIVAVALHETVGFGLQTPLNRYLLAVWIGLVFGVSERLRVARARDGGAQLKAAGGASEEGSGDLPLAGSTSQSEGEGGSR